MNKKESNNNTKEEPKNGNSPDRLLLRKLLQKNVIK